jgi:hypothetical protein
MKKLLIYTVLSLSFIASFAQGKTTKETVKYINSKSPKEFQVTIDKDRELKIDFFKGGAPFKTDIIYLGTIDPIKTSYSKEESAIIIRCFAEMPKQFKKMGSQCIDREFHTKGKRASYNRSLIHYEGSETSINGIVTALNHLINICQDEGEYRYIEEFE